MPDQPSSAGVATSDDRVSRFAAAVGGSAAGYHELPDWAAVAAHVAAGAERVALTRALDEREPTLDRALRGSGVTVIVPTGDDPAAQVADVPVGIVAGELGVAETGSVLVSEHDLADRVVTMLCHRLVLVVRREVVADRLEEAADWLSGHTNGAGFAALITGPSRTADIERSLTIGVQGPREVDVVVLG